MPFLRRDFLRQTADGFGGLALAYLLNREGLAASPPSQNPLGRRHHTRRRRQPASFRSSALAD
jgi:hypothetical protein